MQKFFVKNEQINEKEIEIFGTDVNHITNVLRLKKDSQIQICNEDTSENYITKILNTDKEKVICEIIEKLNTKVETNIYITVYQGLPKADKMELIIQKVTEIGVKTVVPLAMERTIVKLDEKEANKKQERWQKIAEVAAKQSKRDVIPKIEKVQKIEKVYGEIKQYDLFIVAYNNEETKRRMEDIRNILNKYVNDKIS